MFSCERIPESHKGPSLEVIQQDLVFFFTCSQLQLFTNMIGNNSGSSQSVIACQCNISSESAFEQSIFCSQVEHPIVKLKRFSSTKRSSVPATQLCEETSLVSFRTPQYSFWIIHQLYKISTASTCE